MNPCSLPTGLARFTAGLALPLLLGSCGTPTWRVDRADRESAEANPATAMLVQDGVRRPLLDPGEEEPIPYYGTVDLSAVPAPAPADAPLGSLPLPHEADRRLVAIEPPVSPWLFPFDFVIEVLMQPFLDDLVVAVELDPPARDAALAGDPGDTEADAEQLRALQERARARVQER